VDETTLPAGYELTTIGSDPETITVPSNGTVSTTEDGYYLPDGTVTGHVFEDTNNNGVQDAGEIDLAGVEVVITEADGTTQVVTTDADGNWTATVAAGTTTVDVDETTLPAGYELTTIGSDPETVTIPSNGTVSTTEDGYYLPESTGTISGHVYEDTNGNGVQDVGEHNLEGVSVIITDNNGDVTTVVTDVDGNWMSTQLPEGDATSDIDEATLPTCSNGVDYSMTEGTDPTTTTVIAGQNVFSDNDGYEPPASIVLEKIDILPIEDTNANGILDAGDTINYMFIVTNTGCSELTDVTVVDLDPNVSVVGNPITLQPGESNNTITGTYIITQDDIDLGSFENSAAVDSMNPAGDVISDNQSDDPDTADDNDSTVTVLDQNPALTLLKVGTYVDVNDNGPDVGDQIIYTFTVENTGNVTLFDVTIEDDLVTVTGGPITLEIGEIDDSTFQAIYIVTQADIDAGQVENIATARGESGEGVVVVDVSDDPTNPNSNTDDPTVTPLEPLDDLIIYNGVSPNGDGINDAFTIRGIENFPDNTLSIYNRWGVEVYNVDGYGQNGNKFVGISEGRVTIEQDRQLPVGTYFYVLKYTNSITGQENKKAGYLYINR
ncbi:DUF7507 domain-containing protein, partial [Croceibacter atlanticus]|uniref:DUF7507 domain-containing protein n=1 Tax=Croceibacter atlanticus TaxID=313588 RepID=UPI0030F5769D